MLTAWPELYGGGKLPTIRCHLKFFLLMTVPGAIIEYIADGLGLK